MGFSPSSRADAVPAARAGAGLARGLLPRPARLPRLPVAAVGDLPELRVHLGVLELHRGDLGLPHAARPLVPVRGDRDDRGAPPRVSARLLDRVPRRAVAEPLPALDRRAVLRHVPHPHARVAQHPRRRGAGRRLPAGDPRPRRGRTAARDDVRRRRRHHLQLPALHGAADVRLARADRAAAPGGGEGPLRDPDADVPARDAAAVGAGDRRGHAAHLHPGGRRLHQRRAPRHAEAADDRQRHPGEVPRVARLPDRGVALVHPHGAILVALLVYAKIVGTEKLTG